MTRELVYTGFMSLDGVVDSSGGTAEGHRSGGWVADPPFVPEAFALKAEEFADTTALLFGRRSYEVCAPYWQSSADHAAYKDLPKYAPSWPGASRMPASSTGTTCSCSPCSSAPGRASSALRLRQAWPRPPGLGGVLQRRGEGRLRRRALIPHRPAGSSLPGCPTRSACLPRPLTFARRCRQRRSRRPEAMHSRPTCVATRRPTRWHRRGRISYCSHPASPWSFRRRNRPRSSPYERSHIRLRCPRP